ncbi:hypothetical protein P7K49_009495 [Saguinus oedipus]|uniref:Uncharacterized protein n=1 Tax=Saguinus oedipus TaxID=9490 RepID=A0ABQ9VLJ0_SAGOE|nr:hypothetical protein P7K49_009495 [Saguinus oedipus]
MRCPASPGAAAPAPAPRRQLDWAINLRTPQPPFRPPAFVRPSANRGCPPDRPVCSRR